ncbi:MAG: SEC-C domain-containing protein [Nitrospirae bacterium]|nr:SEC-C domain-containing protein [Nitrospirota bacterium]
MAHSGKNIPCPCGSGRLYEKCCGLEEAVLGSGGRFIVTEGLPFQSIQELQAELDRHKDIVNAQPLDDFCGLSPIQMYGLLYHPFESPDIVEFNNNIEQIPESPFTGLFIKLLDACREKRLKLTATGNLPRNFCRAIAREYFSTEQFDDKTLSQIISTELNFDELHTVNVIAQLCGYIKKHKGRLLMTKKGEKIFADGISGKDFFNIFKNYTIKFNWPYRDNGDELPTIQHSFLFTLYLLKKYGDIYRSPSFYAALFLKAFPMALDEVPERSYSSKEQDVTWRYNLRALENFIHFLGFARFNILEEKFFSKKYELEKTVFLDEFIMFHK